LHEFCLHVLLPCDNNIKSFSRPPHNHRLAHPVVSQRNEPPLLHIPTPFNASANPNHDGHAIKSNSILHRKVALFRFRRHTSRSSRWARVVCGGNDFFVLVVDSLSATVLHRFVLVWSREKDNVVESYECIPFHYTASIIGFVFRVSSLPRANVLSRSASPSVFFVYFSEVPFFK